MKHKTSLIQTTMLTFAAVAVVSCASLPWRQDTDVHDTPTAKFINTYDSATMQHARMAGMAMPNYKPAPMATINQYAQSLMHDLVAGLEVLSTTNFTMGVTSFVYLDSELQNTDILGNQLAEALMHEANQFGIAVTDFKTTDSIRVTPDGDFMFSRDFLELTQQYPLAVLLGGTMVRQQGGILVNARIVNMVDKKILGSAQTFIPDDVAMSLQQSYKAPMLQLKAADGF